MKTIFILLDTLRKNDLSCYNPASDVKTPYLDKLASTSSIFNKHCTGSLPCMPARRDLLTGRIDFLDRFWGGLEPFDVVFPKELSLNKITTHISTDHQHYFKFGGEGYVQYYDSWEFFRGQESDAWISHIDNYQKPVATHGRFNEQFERNKTQFTTIDKYPTIQTFDGAIRFIESHQKEEHFFLHIEGFDPHEPFEAPQQFMDLYDLHEDDIAEFYNSPQYGSLKDTPEQLAFIIKKYKANLSFADFAVGRLLNKLEELGIYNECNIILTTDHGFHLGEHHVIGKGCHHIYTEISDIPLLIKQPNQSYQQHINALTQNIDIMPTLFEQYNLPLTSPIHGQSLIPLIDGRLEKVRDYAISGYHGQSMMITDGAYTLFNAPVNENSHPLFTYTAMPTMIKGFIGSKYSHLSIQPEQIEVGRFLTHTHYPVFKIPMSHPTQKNPMYGQGIFTDELYAQKDMAQCYPLDNPIQMTKMKTLAKQALIDYQAPVEQFERLGL